MTSIYECNQQPSLEKFKNVLSSGITIQVYLPKKEGKFSCNKNKREMSHFQSSYRSSSLRKNEESSNKPLKRHYCDRISHTKRYFPNQEKQYDLN